jgi:ribosomal protein S18 acetylase RimI-like enzyme
VTSGFRIEALTPTHDRKNFSCGVAALDQYLRERVSQDIKRRISNCFVALDESGAIAGYYTFAATSLPLTELPADMAKRLPRYPIVPAGLIGRLAVAQGLHGRRLGGALVMDAAMRAARSDPAIFALVVDAKNASAIAFYERLGFQRFASKRDSLFLSIGAALKAFDADPGLFP